MSALKAGDKVKVEFEGTVEGATYDNVSIWVRRDDGLDNYVRIADLVKIVPPEPAWGEGDVILFQPSTLPCPILTPQPLTYLGRFSPCPWRMFNSHDGYFSDSISIGWADGRVTRLVPEVVA